jgi:hypothetical protein
MRRDRGGMDESDIRLAGDVPRNGGRLAAGGADLIRHHRRTFRRKVVDGDRITIGGEFQSDRATDAGACTRDESTAGHHASSWIAMRLARRTESPISTA